MTLTVARKLIRGRGDLPQLAALALTLIDGGPQWLSWAATDPTAAYAFADETEMLKLVQQGLHQSPLALLPNLKLLVSPMKLMTLSVADLSTLAKAENGGIDPVTMQQLRTVLSVHQLSSQDELAAVDPFLASLEVADAAPLQCLGLDDRKTLLELMKLPQLAAPAGAQADVTDAAAFAADLARTPKEFADYFRVYLAQTAKLKVTGQSADQRRQVAEMAVQTLLPLMFSALDCPQVGGIVAPSKVADAVTDWLRKGRRIGFSRVSEGVCRIVDSTTFTTETGSAAQQVVNLYLANSMSFLATNGPRAGRMSQDGGSCLFPIQSGNLYAELRLEETGGITLRQFRRLTTAEQGG